MGPYHRRQRVLGPTCKHYFDHYRQRLDRYGTVLQRSARAVLKALAEAPRARISTSALYDVYRKARKQGASEEEFNELMADLECDWYVALDTHTNEYFFLVGVMKDWGRRWYGPVKR